MSTGRYTFEADVIGDDGWIYDNAFVAIRSWSKSSQDTGVINETTGSYNLSCTLEAVAYSANYWNSEKSQLKGSKSRPLYNLDGDSSSDLFQVDLDHEESMEIKGRGLPSMEMTYALIEADVKRRSKNI